MNDSLGHLLYDLDLYGAELYEILVGHYGLPYLRRRLEGRYLALVLSEQTLLVVPGPRGRAWLGYTYPHSNNRPSSVMRSLLQRRALERFLPQGYTLVRRTTHHLLLLHPTGHTLRVAVGLRPQRSITLQRLRQQHPQEYLLAAGVRQPQRRVLERYQVGWLRLNPGSRQLPIPSPYLPTPFAHSPA